jgi:hypothetical protein
MCTAIYSRMGILGLISGRYSDSVCRLETIMGRGIQVRKLTRFETVDDGTSIKIFVEDATGQPATLSFPIECLTSLMMTLPGMVTAAVQRQKKDPTLRVTFPLEQFEVELGSDLDTRILTLRTPDGFAVSFSLSEEQCRGIGCAGLERTGTRGSLTGLN